MAEAEGLPSAGVSLDNSHTSNSTPSTPTHTSQASHHSNASTPPVEVKDTSNASSGGRAAVLTDGIPTASNSAPGPLRQKHSRESWAKVASAASPSHGGGSKEGEELKPVQVRSPAWANRASQRSPVPLPDATISWAKHTGPLPHRTTRALHEPIINRDSPGPTYYPDVTCCRPRNTEVLFGTSPRRNPMLNGQKSPGPVYYVAPSWHARLGAFSKDERFPLPADMPAPTDYVPDHTLVKRTVVGGKIGQQPRKATEPICIKPPVFNTSEETQALVVLVGMTQPKKNKKKPRRIIGGPLDPSAPCTFGVGYATKPLKQSASPGPGAYHQPTALGQKGLGATLNKAVRDFDMNQSKAKLDYEADIGMYDPNFDFVKLRAPAPMCYLSSS